MAGIYNGHLLEFPTIRVDCFLPSSPSTLLPSLPSCSTHPYPLKPAPNAQLFLLTHVHSDHLMGLSDSFTGKIICSPDTKRMLLALEAEVDRGLLEEGKREVRRLKYPGLRRRVEGKGKDEKMVDRIEAVPYGFPKEYKIGYEDGKPQTVTITLLDANHCPGSTMFLITSPTKAVLHTGDIRADKLFIQTLGREPAIQPFLAPLSTHAGSRRGVRGGRRILDRIYLDTGAILGTGDMPDREPILQDLVEQMSLFPENTIFFLDTWCFGWEYVVKEVARYLNEPVHVDRYKRSIYTAIETDPYLLMCTTTDAHSTRFHACERTHKCMACRRFESGNRKPVYNLDKRIVSVNMVEVKEASWAMEHQDFLDRLGKAALGEGPWPYNINVPLARHSPLPELQNLVKLFEPKSVSPNTVTAGLKGMDYYLLPEFLSDCVDEGGSEAIIRERNLYFEQKYGKGFLEGLERMKVIGLGGSSGDQRAILSTSLIPPTKFANNHEGKSSSSRSSMSKEQIFRMSGLPPMRPDELLHMVGIGISGGMPQMGNTAARHMEEYETEEESPRKRKRVDYMKEESDDFGPEPSPPIVIKREESPVNIVKTSSKMSSAASLIAYNPSFSGQKPSNRNTSNTYKHKKSSRFSLGQDDKERIRKMMERDRLAFEGVGDDAEER
ncbi:hypothetical protein I204_05244 [Kwoniella mangroviensis CBS 8886]|uniref:uncharacterized protein n=1 Tax=Kwoniella mangroviensis CBS 8507 TaxID=1296122 RepID=UPI00080D6243|nr:uncharacterized protein I203_04597 [Kwoniella mangroviensis CBS 8507]OCF66270.1 hypothetical protein I203_04597 [Kwoniella mangroviensis CBS 8507]OCF73407.1 hypothetical protein I204_05244 [Kwoniella mangroviensis CBS 8886]